jgi:ribosomal-protein-alanine N-acetyltransferase
MKAMSNGPVFLESDRLYFRALTASDAEGNYLSWMNDSEVTQYLESRFQPHSAESLKAFIHANSDSSDLVFCAIVLKHDHRHIGNIKLGPIERVHQRADVGLIIGEKECWGKGYGTEAYKLMVEHAFLNLNLHKVTAGAYVANEASVKALQRAGFTEEGRRRAHCFLDGQYTDVLLFGVLKDDFERQELIREALENPGAPQAQR